MKGCKYCIIYVCYNKKDCGLYNIKLNIILGDPLDQKSRYELHMMKMAKIGLVLLEMGRVFWNKMFYRNITEGTIRDLKWILNRWYIL